VVGSNMIVPVIVRDRPTHDPLKRMPAHTPVRQNKEGAR